MNAIIPVRARLTRLLLDGHSTITFVLGLVALLLCGGFVFTDHQLASANTYSLLIKLMPFTLWAVVFYVYGISKVIISLYRTPYHIKIATIIIGLWLWTYIAISFIVVNEMTLPIELVMITPIRCEVWDFSMTIFNRRYYINKRKLHAAIKL